MACRFPGAPDPDAYWTLLREGRDAVTVLPADRFSQAWFHHPRRGEPGRSYSFAAGHLGDVSLFDAGHFGMSPREAAEADPQQRLLLEVVAEAFDDAGWPHAGLAGKDVAVFVGGSSTDYGELRLSDPSGADRYFMTGNTLSILANRITNVFDLRGPAQTVDTACSSSLVALSLAVDALRAGRAEAAVVGGVQMLLSPYAFAGFSKASMLSPTGRCRPFSAEADGYVRAEGAGAVVLKPLDAARRDGDSVRGVILAAGVNAVGRSIGLSLPNPKAQAALMRRVLEEAGIAPSRVTYFEAHGTGTAVGDPAEATAIGEVFGGRGSEADRDAPLPIGSAKSNLGHLEPASGMAGLLKALLVLEHGVVPPSLHCAEPNPRIDFAALNLRVATEAMPLPTSRAGEAPVVGVNSFGFGGTNASVLVGRAPRMSRRRDADPRAGTPPLVISASSAGALASLAKDWAARLRAAPARAIPALLRGNARYRDLLPHRMVARGPKGAMGGESLAAALEGATPGHALARPDGAAGVAFAFSGNGSQFPGMARDAMANRAFREGVEAVDAHMAPRLGWSVARALADGVGEEALGATEVAQPTLFAVQAGIVAALRAEGIVPTVIYGHSVGEAAAALAAGILDAESAARLVVARSTAQARTRGRGRMAALGTGAEEAGPLLAECGPGLEIAALNAPRSVTVAGPVGAIRRVVAAAAARRLTAVELDLDYAFHSAAMEEVREDLLAALDGLPHASPRVPMISTVTGAVLEEADAAYWWRNLREPVRFADAALAAAALTPVVLEVGPNAILQSYIRESLRAGGDAATAVVMPSLSRRDAPGDPVPGLADRLILAGADPRGGAAFDGPALDGATRRGLPRTAFHRARHWLPGTGETARLHDPAEDHPLLGFRRDAEGDSRLAPTWRRMLDTALLPWLADHRLGGEAVMPASGMVEMALAAAAHRFPDAAALEVSALQILRPLPVPTAMPATASGAAPGVAPGAASGSASPADAPATEMRCRLSDDGTFRIEARRRLSGEAWALHARGLVRGATMAALGGAPPPLPDDGRVVSAAEVLSLAARAGLEYGPAFRGLGEVALAPDGAAASLVLPDAAPSDKGFHLHPVRLDAALQGLLALVVGGPGSGASSGLSRGEAWPPGEAPVPTRFERLVLRRGAGPAVRARLRVTHGGSGRGAEAAILLLDAEERVVAAAEGVWFTRARVARREDERPAIFRMEDVPGNDPSLPLVDVALAPALAAAEARDDALDISEAALLLEGYATAAAVCAFAGPPMDSGRTAPRVVPATAYAAALLRGLEEDGLAEADGAAYRLSPATDLPPPDAIWRSVLEEQPVLAHDLAWLALAAERLPQMLVGAALTGAAEPAPMPEETGGLDRLAQVLADAAGAVAAGWPAERPLRVLDLGGPALARHLRVALLRSGRRVLHAHPVAEGLAGTAPGGTVEVVPIEWSPADGRPPPFAADLIVGLLPGTRTGLGTAILPGLASALAGGGTLLLVEALPGRVMEFVSGGTPPPGAAGWRDALSAGGWTVPQALALDSGPWPAALLAARHPGTARPVVETPPRAVLVADAGAAPLAAALSDLLREGGTATEVARLEDAAGIAPKALRGAPVVALAAPRRAGLPTSLAGIARLAEAASGAAERLVIVAQGDPTGMAAEAVRGLGRVLANEMPDLPTRRLLVDAALTPRAAAARLLPSLFGPKDDEAERVLGLGACRVPRIVMGQAAPTPGAARLALRGGVGIGNLHWEELRDLPSPGPGEVRVRVEAAGLNFRDLMWAQGLLPEETLRDGFAGPGLGMEFAGVVEDAAPGTPFRPGARVFGFAPRALATRTVTRAEAIAPIPEGLSFAAAATIPVAFLTAVYALETMAKLGPGERVLIHGGAGGVGLAALQVARAAGALVAVTAGTEAKRAFLRAVGADLVLDSRDPGFDDALRAHWPDGVDVALNSLAGDAMERTLALVRPFGRFVELGKRDYAEDRRIAVRPFRRNVTYFGVDVDQLPRARPAEAARLLDSIRSRLASGDLLPLPYARRGAEEAEGAFRLLQASGHIGKIVVVPPRGDTMVSRGDATLPLRGEAMAPLRGGAMRPGEGAEAGGKGETGWAPPAGTIVVTGGTSGFGLECAKWLAARGAGRIALVSRRGAATPGIEAALTALGALGARVSVHAADAADAEALGTLLDALRGEGPIAGVVHAAAAYDDGVATAMDAARFARVLGPKATAAENLDRLTARDAPSLFLLFSSATTAFGNPGQANYVAANAALEALARRRHAAGRPALAVGWGPIADAGILARETEVGAALARRLGVEPMPAAEALDALPQLLSGGPLRDGLPVAAIARVSWRRAGLALPVLREAAFAPVVAGARGEESAADAAELRAALATLPEGEARARLVRIGAEEIGRILRLAPEGIAADAPLARLGLDSLGALELRGALEARLGATVPLTAVTEDLTVGGLAGRMLEGLRGGSGEAAVQTLMEHFEPAAPDAASSDAPPPGDVTDMAMPNGVMPDGAMPEAAMPEQATEPAK